MVRPQRVEYEGAYYHVMNLGQGRQNVYHGERYYENFLDYLEQAHKRFALEVHAYCLMSNHYHLLVRTKKDLLTAKRGSGVDNTARAMAMKLCQQQGSMKLLEIRELFGLVSGK